MCGGCIPSFKTTIGVYSLRAKADVPYISVPVTWDELDTLLRKGDPDRLRFTPKALLKRLEEVGELFAPLLSLKQRLPAEGKQARSGTVNTPAQKARTTSTQNRTVKNRPVATIPRFVEPMLLLRTDRLPEGSDWLYELKFDGYRALAIKADGRVRLRSRNDKDFNQRFAPIACALAGIPDNTIIDGEIVALDEDGRPSFNLLQNYGSTGARLAFYVFDLLVIDGENVMKDALFERRKRLQENVLPKLSDPVVFSPDFDASLPDLIESVKEHGFEGLVAKRRDSVYEPGQRSGKWQKMRVNQG